MILISLKEKGFRAFSDCNPVRGKFRPNIANTPNFLNPLGDLLTNTQFFDQGTVLQNVFLCIVAQQAFAVTYEAQQSATASEVFFVGAQVRRKLLNTIGMQSDLGFCAARVLFIATVFFYDLGDFVFSVINCHCKMLM